MLAKIRNLLAAFAVVALAAGSVATDKAWAQAGTSVTIQSQANGSVVVTLANGTQVTVPATLMADLTTALATNDPQQLENNMESLISDNAATDTNLAEALVAIALNRKPDEAVSIIVGATEGNSAGQQGYVNLAVGAGLATLQELNLAFALNNLAPAAGTTPAAGTVTITATNTTENPSQASGNT